MKKILVKYTMEIQEDKFEKSCYKTMINKKEMTFKLRDMAETHGRTQVYNWVNEIISKRNS